jgi:hypothetical protein
MAKIRRHPKPHLIVWKVCIVRLLSRILLPGVACSMPITSVEYDSDCSVAQYDGPLVLSRFG